MYMSDKTIEELEKQKLSLEIKELERPFIARPGSWFSAVTVLVALGGMIGQNILSDIKIQRESLKAEKVINQAEKRVALAKNLQKEAEKKAADANESRIEAINETNALRWEGVALDKEKIALQEQTATAREGLKEILAKVEELRSMGIDPTLISGLQDVIFETESRLSYCTPEEAAVYDKALPLDKEQSVLAMSRHFPWGAPKYSVELGHLKILSQAWWVVGYSPKLKVPQWVGYRLDGSSIKALERKDCWRPDPRIKGDSIAKREDFRGSGYDRGHLVPRADMTNSELSAASVYIYSNIAPQEPNLNRRMWSYLERRIRGWAQDYEHLFIIKGAIFDWDNDGNSDKYEDIKKIGPGNVAVPSHYFAIITRTELGQPSHILAFLLPNKKDLSSKDPEDVLKESVVSVGDIERISGLIFLPGLNEKEKSIGKIESKILW